MRKKASIELSMNFIVMFILAILVFGLGLMFLRSIMTDADDITSKLDSQTEAEIERILASSGNSVALPSNIFNLNRGDNGVIGIGIKNNLRPSQGNDNGMFYIITDCKEAFEGNEPICDDASAGNECDSCEKWITKTDSFINLGLGAEAGTKINVPRNDIRMESLFISIPKNAETGRYLFTLDVKYITNTEALPLEIKDLAATKTFTVNIR